jgi:hypothetical protein
LKRKFFQGTSSLHTKDAVIRASNGRKEIALEIFGGSFKPKGEERKGIGDMLGERGRPHTGYR